MLAAPPSPRPPPSPTPAPPTPSRLVLPTESSPLCVYLPAVSVPTRRRAAQMQRRQILSAVIHPKPASRNHRRAGARPISYFLSPLCKSSEEFSKASESGVCCDASWPPPPGLHAPHSPWKCVTLCFPCGAVSPFFNSPPLCLQSRLEPRRTLFVSTFGNGGGGGRRRGESAVGEGVVCGGGGGEGRGRGC